MGHIAATPLLKEDHSMGIMVGKFDLDYNAFDNMLASGKHVVFLIHDIFNHGSTTSLSPTCKHFANRTSPCLLQ